MNIGKALFTLLGVGFFLVVAFTKLTEMGWIPPIYVTIGDRATPTTNATLAPATDATPTIVDTPYIILYSANCQDSVGGLAEANQYCLFVYFPDKYISDQEAADLSTLFANAADWEASQNQTGSIYLFFVAPTPPTEEPRIREVFRMIVGDSSHTSTPLGMATAGLSEPLPDWVPIN